MAPLTHTPIVDAHAHLGRWGFPTDHVSGAGLAAELAARGVATAVVSHSLAISYDASEGNARLAAEIRDVPQLYGYASVNLNYPERMADELQRYLGRNSPLRGKFVGAKVHPMYARHSYDTPEGMALTALLAELDVPVLVHTLGSTIESPRNVLAAAKAFPKVKFLLGHMGGEAWSEGAQVGREAPNLYLELCGTTTDPEKVRTAVAAVGPERVLWGTDATLFTVSHMLGAMEDMGLTKPELEMIMGGNARALFPSIDAALK